MTYYAKTHGHLVIMKFQKNTGDQLITKAEKKCWFKYDLEVLYTPGLTQPGFEFVTSRS